LLQQMLGTSNSLPTQALACYVNDVNAWVSSSYFTSNLKENCQLRETQ
jgi:hypothetical protein